MTSGMSDLLKSTPVFRRLAPPDRERVATLTSARQFERGDTIFSEGDPAEQFFVVVSGRVKVYKMTPAGKDVILEIFGAGDPLGAVAVYEGWPFPASAQALEETVCLAIARRDFFELLEQHPSLVRGLLAGLTMRLVELTNRLAELTGGRVEPRIARLFLKLANEIGRPERGGLFLPLSLSRQELADLSGTTIETAIRIMSRWSKQQIVLTEKDGFVIVNRPELETLALS
jgi:CRP/FNR family transcriptional regulator, dissimilatory nitrate respiration regulator